MSLGPTSPGSSSSPGSGAIVLTFLAGAELDPVVFRRNWKEASAVGLIGFFAPFFGCAAVAYWVLGWGPLQSWLAGVALSTTSVAVVYAVMLEYGFNKTDYGKTLLAACFITDLGTVLALGFIFAPFTIRTFIFASVAIVLFVVLPWLTPRLFKRYGNQPCAPRGEISATSAVRSRGAGRLGRQRGRAAGLHRGDGACRHRRQGSRADPAPAHARARAARADFIRAGSFVSIPALVAAPIAFIVLLLGKMVTKFIGVYPVTKIFGSPQKEAMYTTLLMSTGLTFGTISALFGLSHGIIDQTQYTVVVAGVVASAVVPTLIANAFFLPRHLLPQEELEVPEQPGVAAAPIVPNKVS